MLLPNLEEARRLSGADDAPGAAAALAERVPTVAMKLGAEGAIAVSGGETVTARAPAVDVVDTTGAGDSFNAGLIAGRLAGSPAGGRARAGGCVRDAVDPRGGAARRPSPDSPRRRRRSQRHDLRRAEPVGGRDLQRRPAGAGRDPPAHRLVRVAGGKAMNVARAAVRLGGEAAVVALAPEHGAAWLREELEREGVTVETLPVPGVLRTCLSVFAADDGTLTEFYEGGAQIDAPTWTAFAELAGRARPGRPLAGRLRIPCPPGAPIDAYAQVVGAGREAGAPVAVDAAGPELTWRPRPAPT